MELALGKEVVIMAWDFRPPPLGRTGYYFDNQRQPRGLAELDRGEIATRALR